MIYEFVYKGETKTVELNDKKTAVFGDGSSPIEIDFTPDRRLFLRRGSEVKEVFAATDGDKTFVDIDGILFEFSTPTNDVAGGSGGGGALIDPSKVFAPMPGKIVKIMVKQGDTVAEKQHLVIVEAMKMENIIIARAKGTVTAVNFAVGDRVDTDTPIIELGLDI